MKQYRFSLTKNALCLSFVPWTPWAHWSEVLSEGILQVMAQHHGHLFFTGSHFWSDAISDNVLKDGLFLIAFIKVIAEKI